MECLYSVYHNKCGFAADFVKKVLAFFDVFCYHTRVVALKGFFRRHGISKGGAKWLSVRFVKKVLISVSR